MFLLVLAHLGCSGQSPESRETIVVVVTNKLVVAQPYYLAWSWSYSNHEQCVSL